MNRPLPAPGPALIAAAAAALVACSPGLDWRQVRPENTGLEALFPCKPLSHAREVPLGGATGRMSMFSCSTSGMTFGVTHVDLGDPARVTPALNELRAAAVGNLGGQETVLGPAGVAGMTPNPQALRIAVAGRRADGSALAQHAAFFAKGTHVYQASVVGTRLSDEALDSFFSGLRLP
ncbi:hypothetical protein [Caldimonas brevitalea]|uniref:Uncharacterized protein n=1 Tax=Caldimonas brevitalea TaxID=413882 RepID=A0A0G3BE56_9BURK|nr:hypothetical protein [Caldimonas brevitalea]AKJ27587.1 hypothetical protein AAW51_0896 [Caldimonas brevitalea]